VAFAVHVSVLWDFGEAKNVWRCFFLHTHGDFCRLSIITRPEDQSESADVLVPNFPSSITRTTSNETEPCRAWKGA
jgi:hypothetical protein